MNVPLSLSTATFLSWDITRHASVRMQQRGIGTRAIEAALTYGRQIRSKGVTYCVIGRKEVQRNAAQGIDLSKFEDVQVLLSADGTVVTVYRSKDLHSIKATTKRVRRHLHQ